ncbi:MAG: hypothetical protein MJ106_06390 [Lentisphaeria bacterium]|nr:hypothetical protein [Lentisphaeria bacterium]
MKKAVLFLIAISALFLVTSCEKQEKPITDGVAETLDYGTTLGKTLNKAKKQIPQMNEEHNRQLEKALED